MRPQFFRRAPDRDRARRLGVSGTSGVLPHPGDTVVYEPDKPSYSCTRKRPIKKTDKAAHPCHRVSDEILFEKLEMRTGVGSTLYDKPDGHDKQTQPKNRCQYDS